MKVTIADAYILAKQLKEKSPKILGIELFGSVLRNGVGHDIDFILTMEDELAREYWSDMSYLHVVGRRGWYFFRRVIKKFLPWLDEAFIWKKKQVRLSRASNLLGVDLILLGEEYRPGTILDVWLLPFDWRNEHTLNKSAVSRIVNLNNEQNTLLFLGRIASTAVKIA